MTETLSFDWMHVCKTCDLKMKTGNIPSQAVLKKLCVTDLPREFRDIRRSEQILISTKLLSKKVIIILKGQSPKLKSM